MHADQTQTTIAQILDTYDKGNLRHFETWLLKEQERQALCITIDNAGVTPSRLPQIGMLIAITSAGLQPASFKVLLPKDAIAALFPDSTDGDYQLTQLTVLRVRRRGTVPLAGKPFAVERRIA